MMTSVYLQTQINNRQQRGAFWHMARGEEGTVGKKWKKNIYCVANHGSIEKQKKSLASFFET